MEFAWPLTPTPSPQGQGYRIWNLRGFAPPPLSPPHKWAKGGNGDAGTAFPAKIVEIYAMRKGKVPLPLVGRG
jgi:hypothetical protein